ncbi:hypothetical protein T439DRAFT_382202 [Meredithblackwellia eburnea MCA 4105]
MHASTSNSLSLRRFDAVDAPTFELQPTNPDQPPRSVLPSSVTKAQKKSSRQRRSSREAAQAITASTNEEFIDWSANDCIYCGCDHSLHILPLRPVIDSESESSRSSSTSSKSIASLFFKRSRRRPSSGTSSTKSGIRRWSMSSWSSSE